MYSVLRKLWPLAHFFALAALPLTLLAQPSRATPEDIKANIPIIDRYIAQQMQPNRIPGAAVVIVSDDSVIYVRGFGTDGFGESVTERTGFVPGSTSKSVTTLAVMQLVERNLIQLDAPVQ